MKYLKNEKKKQTINYLDILLILGVIISPMTEFRIWKVGPSEFLILIWSILTLYRYMNKIVIDYNIKLILSFNLLLFVGLAYRVFFNIEGGQYLEEIFVYIFFTVFIIALVQYTTYTQIIKMNEVLKVSFWLSSIIYIPLYLYAKYVNDNLFGVKLWYGNIRLSLFSMNPHQLNFIIGPIIILGVYLIFRIFDERKHKVVSLIIVLIFLKMGFDTQSSTFKYTMFLLGVIYLFAAIRISSNDQKNKIVKTSLFFFLISLSLTMYKPIFNIAYNFVESDNSGFGRINLWIDGLSISLSHYMFPLGPGSHIPFLGKFFEAHSNPVDILLRMGLIGLLLYLGYFIKTIVLVRENVFAICLVLFYFLYGISGYSITRITLWFFIILITYIEINSKKKNISNDLPTR